MFTYVNVNVCIGPFFYCPRTRASTWQRPQARDDGRRRPNPIDDGWSVERDATYEGGGGDDNYDDDDDDDGRVMFLPYFFRTDTGESTWSRPREHEEANGRGANHQPASDTG